MKHLARFGAAVGLTLATGSASLACPVAADLSAGGVRFMGPDGTDEVHLRLSENQVQIDLYQPNIPGTNRAILIHGVYLQWLGVTLEDGSIDRGSISVIAREISPDDMPMPVPGLRWSAPQQYVEIGAGTTDETVTIEVGPATTWTLGACTYEIYPLTVTTESDQDRYVEGINFIPALNTGVLVSYRDSEINDTYAFVDVVAEPQ